MPDYKVGQILYIIPADTTNVVPVQVMERRISETVTGTAVKHVVRTPKSKAQPLILETVKGLIFSDIRVARELMLRNATAAIDSMIKRANDVARHSFFPQKQQQVQQQPQQQLDDPFDTTGILTENEDIQDVQQHDEQDHSMNDQTHVLPPPPALDDIDSNGMTEIMLPDGTTHKVRAKISS